MDRHEVENLRRSIAMLAPGALALPRHEADALLRRLFELEKLLDDLRRLLDDLDDA